MRLNGFWPGALILIIVGSGGAAAACTNLIVTRGASADGSVMITYTCDGEFHPRLRRWPAADHAPGDSVPVQHWNGAVLGAVAQVPHTYAVVNLMNEHQVVMAETTFDGRPELENPEGLLPYWILMNLALQRARTAREAILVMADLVATYGYRSTGESFSIGDPREAWLMEMIGPGPGGSGALWVARRIPDGAVSCHANMARIGEFPRDDPERCLYAANVISFAVQRGYYDPAGGKPFSFRDAYCPDSDRQRRYTATRVWSLLRRVAPSAQLSPDYHRGVPGAEPYPLWIEPDRRLRFEDVVALMRDHYEGTPWDMTQGVDAGPFGSPNRWRPMTWTVDGADYSWERPISTQQTGYSFISQSRAWLPDAVGGVLWYGVDDTYTTCYVPLYCGIEAVPTAYAAGTLRRFSWDSAWWVFNFVANLANLKYSAMIADIQVVQQELESRATWLQPAFEKVACEVAQADPQLLASFLTDYSLWRAGDVVDRWRQLGEDLLTRYNDGYVQDEDGHPQEVGYQESWLRDVLRLRPEAFRMHGAPGDSLPTELPY